MLGNLGIVCPPLSGWAEGLSTKFTHWWNGWRDGFSAVASGTTVSSQSAYLALLRSTAEAAFEATKAEYSLTYADLDAFLASFPPFASEEF